jgi:hypothetical protein
MSQTLNPPVPPFIHFRSTTSPDFDQFSRSHGTIVSPGVSNENQIGEKVVVKEKIIEVPVESIKI